MANYRIRATGGSPYQIRVTGGNPYQIKVKTAAQGPAGPAGPQGEQGLPGAGYTLPTATDTTLGGVKIGDNLTIDVNGVLHADTASWSSVTGKPTFAAVATSGSYLDLSNTPNLSVYLTTAAAQSTYYLASNPSGFITSASLSPYLLTSNFTYANITGKPTLANVAESGDYNDLINKPSAISAAWGSISGTLASQTDLQTALDGKQASGSYVLTADSRLSDARTPLTHTQAWSTITATPTTLAGYGITDAYSSSNPSGYITTSALTGYLTTATAGTTYTPLTRTITAGTGLSGGGNLSADRTLSLAASGVTAGQYGSGSIVPKITVDTYGRITAVQSDTIYPDWNNISSKPTTFAYTTANTFSAAQNLADNELIRAKLKDYSETRATPAITGGTLTLDLETGNFFAVSLNANISTLTITNPPASGSVGSFTLELTADGTARTINWGSIKWPGGTAPTLTSASGKRDIFVFYTTDAGTNWYGLIGGQNL